MIATIQGAPSISEIRMLSTIALPCLPYADSEAFPPIPHRTFITRGPAVRGWGQDEGADRQTAADGRMSWARKTNIVIAATLSIGAEVGPLGKRD